MHALRRLVSSADKAAQAYIAALDAERDLLVLAQHGLGIRPECARVLRVLTMLLKKAAARGLTPFHIGSIMCRCFIFIGPRTRNKAHTILHFLGATQKATLNVVASESSWLLPAALSDAQYTHVRGVILCFGRDGTDCSKQPPAWGAAAFPKI